METKICTQCGREPQPIENFPWRWKDRGIKHSACKDCVKGKSSNWYYENQDRQKENVKLNNQNYRQNAREFILEYLSTHPCSQCGESDPRVLEFHHLGQKDSEVSSLIGRGASLDALQAEISKCVVLCANCHRRLTSDQKGWWKGRR